MSKIKNKLIKNKKPINQIKLVHRRNKKRKDLRLNPGYYCPRSVTNVDVLNIHNYLTVLGKLSSVCANTQ